MICFPDSQLPTEVWTALPRALLGMWELPIVWQYSEFSFESCSLKQLEMNSEGDFSYKPTVKNLNEKMERGKRTIRGFD